MGQEQMRTRVVLADDHRILREGLRGLLAREPDMEVVGEAGNGHAAFQLVRQLSPDVVVMDVTMPDLNGIETTRQITHDYPRVKVLALSVSPSRRVVTQMLHAGASGYLLKTCPLEELARAIRLVVAGKTCLSPDVAGDVVQSYVRQVSANAQDPFANLTVRERQVLQSVAEGKSSKEIASALHVTTKTVGAHRQHIMDKLGVRTVAGLTKHAIREGLTPLES